MLDSIEWDRRSVDVVEAAPSVLTVFSRSLRFTYSIHSIFQSASTDLTSGQLVFSYLRDFLPEGPLTSHMVRVG